MPILSWWSSLPRTRAQHEQDIADDRAGQRRPHHLGQACCQGSQANDDLRRIPKGRIEQTTDPVPEALRQGFGGDADQPGERDESQCGKHKRGQWCRMERFSEHCRRNRE